MIWQRVLFRRSILIAAVISVIQVQPVRADESLRQVPAPESADLLPNDFDRQLEGEVVEPVPFEDVIQNSRLTFHFRNYYFNRQRPENTDPRAWAQGNSLEYKVDKVGGYFGLAAEYFGSFKLDGSKENDGTLLLGPGQDDIDVLGVLNPKATFYGQVISVYRQKYDLPFLNQQDNRMIPNTFEGYSIAMPKTENERFQYVVAYVDKIKTRADDEFDSMSEVAGVENTSKGLTLGGARFYILPELSISAINLYVADLFNTTYSELVHKKKFNDDIANSLSLQFADQRSVGDDLLNGENYTSGLWGVLNAFSYKHAILKTGFNMTDTGATVRSPYGSYPGYTSSIVEDFNRAGEKSWMVGLSYEFGRLNLKELSLTTAYIHGFDAVDEVTKESLADKDETDVTLDYKPDMGFLSGLWIRARGAFVHEEGVGTTQDYRIIVNYDIPLYKPDEPAPASSTSSTPS